MNKYIASFYSPILGYRQSNLKRSFYVLLLINSPPILVPIPIPYIISIWEKHNWSVL